MFIGRECGGPQSSVFNLANTNCPNTTRWDWSIHLKQIITELPVELADQEIKHWVKTVRWINEPRDLRGVPTTIEVYQARKTYEGLVIGPLDNNMWGGLA